VVGGGVGGAAEQPAACHRQLRVSGFAHAAACPLTWLQVAYMERIRERYFGRDYAQEVAWVDSGGTGGGNRSDSGGGHKPVGAAGTGPAGRRRSVLLKEE
jgi:hypothetical protein